jgi:hypothetical protein
MGFAWLLSFKGILLWHYKNSSFFLLSNILWTAVEELWISSSLEKFLIECLWKSSCKFLVCLSVCLLNSGLHASRQVLYLEPHFQHFLLLFFRVGFHFFPRTAWSTPSHFTLLPSLGLQTHTTRFFRGDGVIFAGLAWNQDRLLSQPSKQVARITGVPVVWLWEQVLIWICVFISLG